MQLDLSRFSPAERSTLQLRVLYEGAGYRKFRCSHFEEYSLYQQNERFLSDSQVITFTDLDGKLRAIKPDVTLSIAKNAQPTAGECKKYYYTEQICRPSRESHTFSEISQMGLECIGAVGAAEQAEVVRLALESLASLEVPTVLEVSHMGFVTALLDTLFHEVVEQGEDASYIRDAVLIAGFESVSVIVRQEHVATSSQGPAQLPKGCADNGCVGKEGKRPDGAPRACRDACFVHAVANRGVRLFPVLILILPDQSASATVLSTIDVVASRVFCFENFPYKKRSADRKARRARFVFHHAQRDGG